jgi:hypothetical protein
LLLVIDFNTLYINGGNTSCLSRRILFKIINLSIIRCLKSNFKTEIIHKELGWRSPKNGFRGLSLASAVHFKIGSFDLIEAELLIKCDIDIIFVCLYLSRLNPAPQPPEKVHNCVSEPPCFITVVIAVLHMYDEVVRLLPYGQGVHSVNYHFLGRGDL